MSLLLDARRKIELALEQSSTPKAIEPQLPETQNHKNYSTQAAVTGMPASRLSEGASFPGMHSNPVAVGKNLFAAKLAPHQGGQRLSIIPIALISCAVIAAGGGYYVWREIAPPAQAVRPVPKQMPATSIAHTAPTSRSAPAPAMQGVVAAVPVALPVVQPAITRAPASLPLPMPPVISSQQTASASSAQKVVGAANKLPPAQPKKQTDQHLSKVDTEEASAPPAPAAQAISIERGQRQASVDPVLLAAWQAYRSGDFDRAGQHYNEILRRDGKNRDALLGMAAIAQQQAQDDAAAHYYRQVLSLDPRDSAAQAGLLSLSGPSQEAEAESRLKLLLAQQPQSAALHFTIGNLYAGQSRWSEAQQSYFAANNLEPDNAQFAFNLAVSLDHLGKSKIAAQYYQRALQLDSSAFPGIDREQTRKRLDELKAAYQATQQ